MKSTEKDFKNVVVMNYGYVYSDKTHGQLKEIKKELTNKKWFDYVVSDEVADTLKSVLDKENVDKEMLKKIVNHDVLSKRNIVYSSMNERKAIEKAKKLSEKTLVLKLHQ